jgi:DNA-binding transcriptional ArsR family regulator
MVQHTAARQGDLRPAPTVAEALAGNVEPPAGQAAEAVADMFKLLGDATRCRILYALLAAPDLTVSAIAAGTGTSRTTVSAALRLLRTAGAVVARRDGREVHYRVADEHVAELLTVARQHSGHVVPPGPAIAAAPHSGAAAFPTPDSVTGRLDAAPGTVRG